MLFDPNYLANLSSAVSSSSLTEQRLTNELSSGLRVSTLSDDPVAVGTNARLSAAISQADTFIQTVSTATSSMQVADSTLGEVVTQVTRALSLATEAGNGTLSGSNLQAIAQQVSDLRDSVVSLANTSYSGVYLFSGSQGLTKPFSLDTSTDPATATYNGDGTASKLAGSEGQSFTTSLPGSSVFQNAGGSVLDALNQLVSQLNAGTTSGIASASAALSAGLGQVSAQRASLGSSLSVLESSGSYAGTEEAQLKSGQSTLLSADTAQVATDLQTSEVQHQALLNVIAGLSRTDLFDYLK